MSTNTLSIDDIKREKHILDADGKILGRLATEAAKLLMGKHKAQFVPYLDTGDYVVVKNAAKVKVTGKKTMQKRYVRHSGYPGGLKVEIYSDMIVRKPEFILEHAISGMLPKGRLGRAMFKKLTVLKGEINAN